MDHDRAEGLPVGAQCQAVNRKENIKFKAIHAQECVLERKEMLPHTTVGLLFGDEHSELFTRKADIAMGVMENDLGKDRMRQIISNKIFNHGHGVNLTRMASRRRRSSRSCRLRTRL